MSHIFISYSRKDIAFASKTVQALVDNALDTWIDWKSIPKGEDWEQEIYRGIEESDAFLFLISPDSVASEMCNKEIAHAVKNGKRILPIFISNADIGKVHESFYTEKARAEISKRNYIFCREGQDDFVRAIEETRKTIHTDYAWLKYHTELQVKALRWEKKKDNSRLLRGKELREAEQQLAEVGAQKDPQPTKIQREYILASQRNELRTRRQITIRLVISLAVMVVLSIIAWMQRNNSITQRNRAEEQSIISESGRIAVQAETYAQNHADLALLLSAESYSMHDSVLSESSLLTSLQKNPYILRFFHNGSTGVLVHFNYDGTILATSSCIEFDQSNQCVKGEVRTYDTASGQLLGSYSPSDSDIPEVAFSPTAPILAIGSLNEVVLLDERNLTELNRISNEKPGLVRQIVFDSKGSVLVVAYDNKSITLYDMASGKQIGSEITAQTNDLAFVAISPDDSIIAYSDVLDNQVILHSLDEKTEDLQISISGLTIIFGMTFNPDGTVLAINGNGGNVFLWDVKHQKQLGQLLQNQNSELNRIVTSIAFSPDGTFLVSSNEAGTIILWDLATFRPIGKPLMGHAMGIGSIALSLDGQTLASGDLEGTVILWQLPRHYDNIQQAIEPLKNLSEDISVIAHHPTKPIIATGGCGIVQGDQCLGGQITMTNYSSMPLSKKELIGHSDRITDVEFSPDGNLLASCSLDGTIILWNVDTGQQIGSFKANEMGLLSIAFHPNGQILASTGHDGKITFWDVDSFQKVGNPLLSGDTSVTKIRFSPDGKYLVSAGFKGQLLLWDLGDSDKLPIHITDAAPLVFGLDFSPDGQELAFASLDTVRVWDLVNQKMIGEPLLNQDMVTGLKFSPLNNLLVISTAKGYVAIWDYFTGKLAYPIIQTSSSLDSDLGSSLCFNSSGSILVTGIGHEVAFWDFAQIQTLGRPLGYPAYAALTYGGDFIYKIAYNKNYNQIAVGGEGGDVVVSSLETFAPVLHLQITDADSIPSVVYDPSGKILATGSGKGSITLWDSQTGQQLMPSLVGHQDAVLSLAFSPDGSILASGSADDTIRLWDVTTGNLIGQPLKSHIFWVNSLAFSPDGNILASGSADGTAILWDVKLQSPISTLRGHSDAVTTVSFNPNGTILATTSGDHNIIFWDVNSGKAMGKPMVGHNDYVLTGMFSPDGKIFASGSKDGTIIIWDVESGRPVGQPLTGHYALIRTLTFLGDGYTLASGDENGLLLLWDLNPASWRKKACEITNRNLSQNEWGKFFPDEPYRLTCPQYPAGQ